MPKPAVDRTAPWSGSYKPPPASPLLLFPAPSSPKCLQYGSVGVLKWDLGVVAILRSPFAFVCMMLGAALWMVEETQQSVFQHDFQTAKTGHKGHHVPTDNNSTCPAGSLQDWRHLG